jgi:diguanylate cyclase (GGDEF) domain
MLRRHLRPYTLLMKNLLRLSEKDADLPGLRRRLEEDTGRGEHEVAAVTAAVARILEMLEEKIVQLEWTSRTDALTQVSNRVHLDGVLQREIGCAEREDPPLSVLILDLDHFKNVNDTFGHEAGGRGTPQDGGHPLFGRGRTGFRRPVGRRGVPGGSSGNGYRRRLSPGRKNPVRGGTGGFRHHPVRDGEHRRCGGRARRYARVPLSGGPTSPVPGQEGGRNRTSWGKIEERLGTGVYLMC